MDRCVRARYRVNQTPAFEMLSEDQRSEIYLAAVEILQRTGARVYDTESRQLLEKAGCWVEGELVRVPSGLTERAVRTAPSKIVLYDRDGNRKLVLQEGRGMLHPRGNGYFPGS